MARTDVAFLVSSVDEASIIRKVDQLNLTDGDMYPPNKPKPNVGQLGLTK